MASAVILKLTYLVASVLFILGLKGLTHPRTAVRGNLLGAVGMLVAVVVTLVFGKILSPVGIYSALAVGALIGAVLAVKIQMTAMPQLVALYNGFGGIASVLVAGMALVFSETFSTQSSVATAASGLIGAVTFWGSLVAFAKLQELKALDTFKLPFAGNSVVTGFLFTLSVVLGAWLVARPELAIVYLLLCIVASVLGLYLVMPIGGADMPVVIALLNSYSGLAACAAGFVIGNNVLIIAGSLVGASGVVLTQIMCKAMNRSLAHVLFGTLGPTEETASADEVYEGKIKATSAEEVAMLFDGVRRVVFVPGYGLAVAQAQHAVRDLAGLLEERGVEVEYGIHPVAGRMPGHMNVLLAEADVPYDKLKEMDEVNQAFAQTDVTIVIGANDVVNPVARTDPNSPIAGMPILDVDKSHTVVVIKRSLSPGFAGIPNPLFAADNTLMFFGDAKAAINELITAVKEG